MRVMLFRCEGCGAEGRYLPEDKIQHRDVTFSLGERRAALPNEREEYERHMSGEKTERFEFCLACWQRELERFKAMRVRTGTMQRSDHHEPPAPAKRRRSKAARDPSG